MIFLPLTVSFQFINVNLQHLQSAQLSQVGVQRPSKQIIIQDSVQEHGKNGEKLSRGLLQHNTILRFKTFHNLQLLESSYVAHFLRDCSTDPVTQKRTEVDHLIDHKFVKDFHLFH